MIPAAPIGVIVACGDEAINEYQTSYAVPTNVQVSGVLCVAPVKTPDNVTQGDAFGKPIAPGQSLLTGGAATPNTQISKVPQPAGFVAPPKTLLN